MAPVEPVERTLDAMMAGGIHDQIGGGFARYSVDASWLVPHFEKMLYDNALLARAYLHGWQALGHERYRRICERTLDWALREMRGPEGGFYSALDADSEGEEGRFYVWTPEEMRAVLGEGAEPVIGFYGVSEAGNFEGRNILHLAGGATAAEPEGLDAARQALYEARAERVRPGLDDKRLTAWNALMLGGPGRGRRGARPRRLPRRGPRRAPSSSCATCATRDGRLLRTYKDGEGRAQRLPRGPRLPAGSAADALRSDLRAALVRAARALADTMIARFGDPERGGFFSTSDDHEALIARRKEIGDHPIPSGNSAAALGLLRLEALTRRALLRRAGRRRPAPLRQDRPPPTRRLRPPPASARLPAGPDQGGGPDRRRPQRARLPSSARATAPTSSWRADQRAAKLLPYSPIVQL